MGELDLAEQRDAIWTATHSADIIASDVDTAYDTLVSNRDDLRDVREFISSKTKTAIEEAETSLKEARRKWLDVHKRLEVEHRAAEKRADEEDEEEEDGDEEDEDESDDDDDLDEEDEDEEDEDE